MTDSPEVIVSQNREVFRRVVKSYLNDVNNTLYKRLIDRDITYDKPVNVSLAFRLHDGSRFRMILSIERLDV